MVSTIGYLMAVSTFMIFDAAGIFLFYRWIHASQAEKHEWTTSEFAEASIIYLLMVFFHVLWFISLSPVIDRFQADRREAKFNGAKNGPTPLPISGEKPVKSEDLESSLLSKGGS